MANVMLRFSNGTATVRTVSWTADKDYLLAGASGSGNWVVSTNGALTYATANESQSTAELKLQFYAADFGLTPVQLNIPIPKDSQIFCAFTAAIQQCILILTEVAQL